MDPISFFETPISLVSYNHVASGDALPTHATDDLIIGIAYRNENSAITIPSGWTSVAQNGGTDYRYAVATKVAASASETATWANTDAVTYVVLQNAGGIGLATLSASTSTNFADLRDGDLLDVKNGTSFVLHTTFANTFGVLQTITPDSGFYTNNTSVLVGNYNCSLLYRAGLISDLPTTDLDYSGSGSAFIANCIEVIA